ncbi:3-oxoacyl-ACP reductase [Rhodococcus erythropolis]|nr:3-oxoacyl-ACP reductase [Rhodococcus erythropolis]EQM32161.1 3-ketoacyl-ACP reductase [Rhodococcus erythropolis DN1]MDJ0403891.1 3-oxoacyl-ACP reductase [Rhodococcus erythropolis]
MTEQQFQRALNLDEQIVLITGGARGLGAALSRAFSHSGARVIVNYNKSRDAAEALVAELGENRTFAVQADVTDRSSVDQLFSAARERFDAPISTVVDNALVDFSFNGDARPNADTITWADFDSQLRGAVAGTLNTTQAALPGMRELGFGRIITVGTNLVQNPVVPYHDYTAAKAALLALTRTLSADLGPDGITVNMVSGGLLRTTDASAATPEAVFDMIAASTPLRRVTTPDEFADAALFFASPWSRAVTGQNLVVDGGLVKN